MTRDERYLELARQVARIFSKDPSTKVGAVLTGQDPRDLCVGYNGFPPGIADTPERLADRPTKYRLTQHAERNALDNAHFPTRGGTVYVTMFPCSACAKSIVSKGIARVVCERRPDHPVARWADEWEWSRAILDEAGVEVCELDG